MSALTLPTDGTSPIRLPWSRWREWPAWLASQGLTHGAEIGVEQGRFSEALCRGITGVRMIAVDAWRAYDGYREHVSQAKLDGFYADTCARLAPYGVDIRRGWSTEIAATVPDRSLDWVYLDGNHRLEYVIADLAAWAPKVRRGGIVAGHDWRKDDKAHPGLFHVQHAIRAWTQAYRIAPWYVLTGDRSPSWMWVQHG